MNHRALSCWTAWVLIGSTESLSLKRASQEVCTITIFQSFTMSPDLNTDFAMSIISGAHYLDISGEPQFMESMQVNTSHSS